MMTNTSYIDVSDNLKNALDKKLFENKRVLFVFGDSWTNNTYLNNTNEYPTKAWSHVLADKLDFDFVVNLSWDGGSNTEIYENCLKTMALTDDYEFDKCEINKVGASEIIVIIGWSSQYRDFGPIHKIFKPYNVSNVPKNLGDGSSLKSKLYSKYMDKMFKKEYYQYTTQVYSVYLQEYFKYHKIKCFQFMAFNPLVESSLVNSEWDLRENIDSNTFYGLYGNSMGKLLNEMGGYKTDDTFVVDQPYYYSQSIMNFVIGFLNKDSKFKEYLELNYKSRNDNVYLLEDGHPNSLGLEVIANELYNFIINER